MTTRLRERPGGQDPAASLSLSRVGIVFYKGTGTPSRNPRAAGLLPESLARALPSPGTACGGGSMSLDAKYLPHVIAALTPPVKARSGHIILDQRRRFKHLVRVYPEIHRKVVEANRPFLKETEPMPPEVILEENLRDLRADRKPMGYNRQDPLGMRLVFPITDGPRAEFYFVKPTRCQEVVQMTELVSQLLKRRGIRHTVEYDRLPLGPVRNIPGIATLPGSTGSVGAT